MRATARPRRSWSPNLRDQRRRAPPLARLDSLRSLAAARRRDDRCTSEGAEHPGACPTSLALPAAPRRAPCSPISSVAEGEEAPIRAPGRRRLAPSGRSTSPAAASMSSSSRRRWSPAIARVANLTLDDQSHGRHVHRGADRSAQGHGLDQGCRRRPVQHVVLARRRRDVDRAACCRASRQWRGCRDPARRGAQLSPFDVKSVGRADGRLQHAPRLPTSAHGGDRGQGSSHHARRTPRRGLPPARNSTNSSACGRT